MTLLTGRIKKKRDISITLTNTNMNNEYKDLFKDGYWDMPKEEIPKSFTIGSLIILCSNSAFFYYKNEIELGDKIYNLSHYMPEGNNQKCTIYDFEKGWLSPLNIPMSTDKEIKLNIPANTSVHISISVI